MSGLPMTSSGTRSPSRRAPVVAAQLVGFWLVLLAMMLGLGSLLSRVEWGSDFEQIDAGAPNWLAARRTDALDAVSGVAAELGNTSVVLVLAVLACAVTGLVWRAWRPVAVIALALAGEVTIFLTTAAVIDRQRPQVPHLDEQLPPTSSFPSGHTAAAICLYGALAAIVLSSTRARWRWWAPGIAIALVVAVGLARLYRGAHYPTDVLGSLLFALPWLLVVLHLMPLGTRRTERTAHARGAGTAPGA